MSKYAKTSKCKGKQNLNYIELNEKLFTRIIHWLVTHFSLWHRYFECLSFMHVNCDPFSSWKLISILRKITLQSYLTIIASNVSCLSKLLNLNLIILSFDNSYLVLSVICPFFFCRVCYPSISSILLSPKLCWNLRQLLACRCFHPWSWNDKSNFIWLHLIEPVENTG